MTKTIIDLFEESVAKFSDRSFLWEKTDKGFVDTSYRDTKKRMQSWAAGLMALGVQQGATTRPTWSR